MDALNDLHSEKKELLSSISRAASEEKTGVVLSESKKLEKIEQLINRHRQIILELEEFRSNKSPSHLTHSHIKKEVSGKDNILRSSRQASTREHGQKIREAFVSKLEKDGIQLNLMKGKTIYQTKSGKRVGIPVATERQPNRWFLGLPVGGFEHAVLLCQKETGDLIEVPLPENFFTKYGDSMSQSNGQIKFNIVQRGTVVLVLVPGTDGVSISSFSSDYSFLS
jgi:hypothetical protein